MIDLKSFTGMKNMTRNDLHHLMEAFDTVEAELEELETTKEWYSSDCFDLIRSSRQIIRQEIDSLER